MDFVAVYTVTGAQVTGDSVREILAVAQRYVDDTIAVERALALMHMGMVAEINKKNTRLGKRIKRLGVHCLLIEDFSVSKAANFMRGLPWKHLDAMCTERGF